VISIGQISAPQCFEGTHTAADGVQQTHVWQPPLYGSFSGGELAPQTAHLAGAAAAHREIAAVYDNFAAGNAPESIHRRFRRKASQLLSLVRRAAHQGAKFLKRSRVEQTLQPLAHRQLALRMLSSDPFLASHSHCQLPAPLQLIQFRFPAHSVMSKQLNKLFKAPHANVIATTSCPACVAGERDADCFIKHQVPVLSFWPF